MPEETSTAVVECSCSARFRVRAEALGKKAKCPKCGKVMLLKAAAPAQSSPPPEPAALNLNAEGGAGLFDELAQQEENAAALAPATPTGDMVHCPSCSAVLPVDAKLCVTCGYNLASGKQLQTTAAVAAPSVAGQLAKKAGAFGLGTMLSALGAAIGGVAWFATVHFANLEVGYIAWGIGVLAGLGMRYGYRSANAKAGVIASVMAILGIVLAKAAIFYILLAAVLLGDTDNPEYQRAYVAGSMTEEMLDERGVETESERETQWDGAYAEAEQRVDVMSDEEVHRRWEEYRAAAEEAAAAEPDAPGTVEGGVDDGTENDGDAGDSVRNWAGLFFSYSFGLFDVLWLLLAVGSAFKIANTESED